MIAPIADRLSNSGNVGITYQYALNSMVGASGTFTNLHYPNPSQVPGLVGFELPGWAGLLFAPSVEDELPRSDVPVSEAVVVSDGREQRNSDARGSFLLHALSDVEVLDYFLRRSAVLRHGSASATAFARTASFEEWTPAAGASMSWQGRLKAFALSYSHSDRGQRGLVGAVQMDSAAASVRQQITKTLSGSVAGGMFRMMFWGSDSSEASNGHSISGTASLQQQFGQHVNLQLGYTRLHQSYSTVCTFWRRLRIRTGNSFPCLISSQDR